MANAEDGGGAWLTTSCPPKALLKANVLKNQGPFSRRTLPNKKSLKKNSGIFGSVFLTHSSESPLQLNTARKQSTLTDYFATKEGESSRVKSTARKNLSSSDITETNNILNFNTTEGKKNLTVADKNETDFLTMPAGGNCNDHISQRKRKKQLPPLAQNFEVGQWQKCLRRELNTESCPRQETFLQQFEKPHIDDEDRSSHSSINLHRFDNEKEGSFRITQKDLSEDPYESGEKEKVVSRTRPSSNSISYLNQESVQNSGSSSDDVVSSSGILRLKDRKSSLDKESFCMNMFTVKSENEMCKCVPSSGNHVKCKEQSDIRCNFLDVSVNGREEEIKHSFQSENKTEPVLSETGNTDLDFSQHFTQNNPKSLITVSEGLSLRNIVNGNIPCDSFNKPTSTDNSTETVLDEMNIVTAVRENLKPVFHSATITKTQTPSFSEDILSLNFSQNSAQKPAVFSQLSLKKNVHLLKRKQEFMEDMGTLAFTEDETLLN